MAEKNNLKSYMDLIMKQGNERNKENENLRKKLDKPDMTLLNDDIVQGFWRIKGGVLIADSSKPAGEEFRVNVNSIRIFSESFITCLNGVKNLLVMREI